MVDSFTRDWIISVSFFGGGGGGAGICSPFMALLRLLYRIQYIIINSLPEGCIDDAVHFSPVRLCSRASCRCISQKASSRLT